MKVIIRGLGHLSKILGIMEVVFREWNCVAIGELLDKLIEVDKRLSEFLHRNSEWYPSAGYLIFVNGTDLRILVKEDAELCGDVTIDIVPVIHHG